MPRAFVRRLGPRVVPRQLRKIFLEALLPLFRVDGALSLHPMRLRQRVALPRAIRLERLLRRVADLRVRPQSRQVPV